VVACDVSIRRASNLSFYSAMEPMTGIEPVTSSLPRTRSAN
jgi:hypothetical protein